MILYNWGLILAHLAYVARIHVQLWSYIVGMGKDQVRHHQKLRLRISVCFDLPVNAVADSLHYR